jgi:hypothetical protein
LKKKESSRSETVINGVVVEEIWQLVFVLCVLAFVLGGIYLMQKYTGV